MFSFVPHPQKLAGRTKYTLTLVLRGSNLYSVVSLPEHSLEIISNGTKTTSASTQKPSGVLVPSYCAKTPEALR